ncbi:MAG: oxidoreductase [Planctomycetota bacterium]|nr:MAG: oxidoreductase [Planctomycetota bacterium]
MNDLPSRRSFIHSVGLGITALGLTGTTLGQDKKIQGFDDTAAEADLSREWKPVSDRKIRVGIVGYGACSFGAAFSFQEHPNVTVAAVSDLFEDRRAALARACRCEKTYPSLEEMIKDDSIEAVFVATDAPSHARHCIDVLEHGKHVACAVPATFGSLEDADKLFEAVKASGLNYMMFETSYFRSDCYAMRKIFKAGGFGNLIYSEGEYYHYNVGAVPSYKNWRVGLPPQWYPTHSNAYYTGVTGGSFTEVSCQAMPSLLERLQPQNNIYKNAFGTEIALLRTSDGGTARMAVSWDTPGDHGERGRVRGQRGSFYGKYQGLEKKLPDVTPTPLPPGVTAGGHGGSHGRLMNEFVHSILENRKPLIDVAQALNLTVAGIVAHLSAIKDGELLKIPQYKFW